ncbi:YceI family protein [Kribbella sp. NPDC048915]|uniref:YceI family protein n=1 Tax=Kribbella sp. NPDC048915 TaxID=3155148 RepID=UPI0033D1D720
MTQYVLDSARTRIGFVAAHRVGPKVRGLFAVAEGAFQVDRTNPAASTGWLKVRMDSVETGDARRDAQLRQEFFGVASYPEMSFVATGVTPTGADRFEVAGDLTIRGTTHPLTVPVSVTDAGDTLHLQASRAINRHTWRANWNALTTALVRPAVELDLSLTATRA